MWGILNRGANNTPVKIGKQDKINSKDTSEDSTSQKLVRELMIIPTNKQKLPEILRTKVWAVHFQRCYSYVKDSYKCKIMDGLFEAFITTFIGLVFEVLKT